MLSNLNPLSATIADATYTAMAIVKIDNANLRLSNISAFFASVERNGKLPCVNLTIRD